MDFTKNDCRRKKDEHVLVVVKREDTWAWTARVKQGGIKAGKHTLHMGPYKNTKLLEDRSTCLTEMKREKKRSKGGKT